MQTQKPTASSDTMRLSIQEGFRLIPDELLQDLCLKEMVFSEIVWGGKQDQ